MSRVPHGNPATRDLKRSVFSQLAHRLRDKSADIIPLHVGDTYLSPPTGARPQDQREGSDPGVHRYANPRGWSELINGICRHRAERDDGPVEPANVLVTAGATGGLATAVQALLAPGQTVLILAPYWPLIGGMARAHGLNVREVPFYDRVDSGADALELLEAAMDGDVGAVYVNWPNNPSGRVASRDVVEAVVELACRHDLWILSDEVYEDFSFAGHLVVPSAVPEARSRTIRVHSFSKAYAMAGARVGYVIGPAEPVARLEQLATYLVYSVNTAGQRSALAALRNGGGWIAEARRHYQQAGSQAARRLGVPPPAGGTFLLLDVADHLDDRGLLGLLEDCLDEGLLVAPGDIFGQAYSQTVRLCFTSVEPERVMAGVDILARRLGR